MKGEITGEGNEITGNREITFRIKNKEMQDSIFLLNKMVKVRMIQGECMKNGIKKGH